MDLVLKCTKIHKLLVHMMTQTQALTKPGSVFRKNKNLEITQFSDKRFLYFLYSIYNYIFKYRYNRYNRQQCYYSNTSI